MKLVLVFVLSILTLFAQAQDRLITLLQPTANAYSVATTHQLKVVDRIAPFAYYETAVGANKVAVMAAMRADNRVVWVEDDDVLESPENQSGGKGSTVGVINDRSTLYQFNTSLLSRISFDPTRAQAAGRSVRIALIDTGLARRSYALWHRVVAQANFVEPGASAYDQPRGTDSNGNSFPDEGVGHGTFIAGIIDQVAPQCPLVIIRAADSDGVATAWRVVKGLAFAVNQGCEVANLSLGTDGTVPALNDTLEWAEARGLLVVGAAGNTNSDRALQPSRNSKVVCVTGVDHNDRKALFANYESSVDTCAPATGIKSAWIDGTTVVWQGTSFAAPWVAGGIADSLRRRPKAFPADLARIAGRAGTGINAINPNYNGKLGVRLNLARLDASIQNLPIRP